MGTDSGMEVEGQFPESEMIIFSNLHKILLLCKLRSGVYSVTVYCAGAVSVTKSDLMHFFIFSNKHSDKTGTIITNPCVSSQKFLVANYK